VLHHQRYIRSLCLINVEGNSNKVDEAPFSAVFAFKIWSIIDLQDFHASNLRLMNLMNLVPYLQDVAKYKLGDPSTFHYLNQTNCYKVSTIDDAREYLETRNAMDVVGISPEEQV